MGQTASAIQMGRFETERLLRLRIATLEGEIIVVDAQRRSRGMSVESAFTYSSHTWLHVLSRNTGRETIWEMPDYRARSRA